MSFLKRRRSSTGGETSKKPKMEAKESQCQYEVFLSFHGKDTRYSFVDILYGSLKDAGIHSFIDEEGLPRGETIGPELLSAIQQSAISIPIFSEGYAQSKWCLLELEEMLKCSKARGQMVLPVFYYVEPRNVRHQDGGYEAAFQKHSKDFSNETVDAWKEALKEVGAIKGWEVKNTADGSQGKIIKSIVKQVLRELKKGYLNVTSNLVGTEQHEKAMLKLLNADSDSSTDIVGIHGIGGIGKTTLAKVIYNQLRDRFEYHSFLESMKDSLLISLQKQLIYDVLKSEDVRISNLDEGMSMIRQRFGNKKVLILFDDVDSPKQLEYLVGRHDWFGTGSKIIITTRDKKILHTCEAKFYELEELHLTASLQLFSKHAFRAKEPPNEYMALSKQFVSIVGGLPLAIEVLGSSLYGEHEEVWKSRLRNLERGPIREVAEKLMITYDILTYEEQQIFLDIACHFVGMDIRVAVHFWDSLSYRSIESVDALLDKSLIKIGDNFGLRMHDQLRDLGRDIVRQKSIREDNLPSRIWNCYEARGIISKKKGNDNVKGLDLDTWQITPEPPPASLHLIASPLLPILTLLPEVNAKLAGDLFQLVSEGKVEITESELSTWPVYSGWTDEQFTKLTKLKFLRVGYAKLEGDFHQLLPELRWLIWAACDLWEEGSEINAPRNFNLESLVILDLSGSNITESWNGWSQIKGKNLRVLNLTACNCLTITPELSSYTNLQRLIFRGCELLVGIDKSIGKLKNLTFLDLRRCHKLKMLTPELESLTALEELLIDDTFIEKLQPLKGMNDLKILHVRRCFHTLKDANSIGHLASLKELALDGSDITHLPNSTGLLVSLESLSLRRCKQLCKLPETIESLKSLSELFLGCSGIVELSLAILRLPVLKTLELMHCHRLELVSMLPSNLIDFRFNWEGSSLEFPRSINLQELCFTKESKLSQAVSLAELMSLYFSELEELTFECREVTTLLVEFSIFTQLKKLVVQRCGQLRCISELPSGLSYLQIDYCPSLEKVPNLSSLSTLRELFITRCYKLREIHGLEGLKLLQRLDVHDCRKLCMLDGIEQLDSLELLNMNRCLLLGGISGQDIVFLLKKITAFNCLKWLQLSDLYSLKALPTLPQSLVTLQVIRCCDLIDWPDMSNLKKLSRLVISWTMLREIQGLGELKSLTHLKIKMCQNLTTLVGLEELVSLECLKLDCCISLQILPNLSNLRKLQIVRAVNCIGLGRIEGLEGLNLKGFTFYRDGSTDSDDFDDWASNKPTEVFLSFCGGEEMLDSFVDLLLTELKFEGVNIFTEEERLRTGESIRPEVRNAIWQSSIRIPIFSKGYAYNKWCLWELEKMLDCEQSMKYEKILAVYYDVEQVDVCNQSGSYEEAFLQHSKDFSVEIVETWKTALREVHQISVYHLDLKDTKGSDAELRHQIVELVLECLRELKEMEGCSDSELEGCSDSELEGCSDWILQVWSDSQLEGCSDWELEGCSG